MRKKNGFVLIETLVVVLLLTVTLMSLYATFSYMVSKTKERNNNDSIDTLYKTYFVKNILDNYELANNDDEDSISYNDSFKYYAYTLMNSAGISKDVCHAYNYYDGREVTNNLNQDQIIVCDFGDNGSLLTSADPLYESVKTYSITKMYYVDYSKLPTNETNKIKVMNLFDASSIDYVNQQSTDLEGNYLIIKYEKDYSYPTNHVESVLDVDTEAYHSSIALSEIVYNSSAKPVYFHSCTSDDCIKYASSRTYNDGSQLILPSTVDGFTDHGGQTISAWSNSDKITDDNIDECVSAGDSGFSVGGTTVYCYSPGDLITVVDDTRDLYAYWCGDGTLNGFLECTNKKSSSSLTYNSGVYKYALSATDNYVAVGNYCWRLMSNFTADSEGIKAIYAGAYDNGCPTDNKNVFIAKSAYNQVKGINSAGYMLPVKSSEMGALNWVNGNDPKKTLAVRAGMLVDHTYTYNSSDALWKFNTKTKITFGKTVTYDENTGLYTISNLEDPVMWYASKESNYTDLTKISSTYIGHYACKDGASTTCDTVYYLYNTNIDYNRNFTYSAYTFQDGLNMSNVYDQKLYFTSDPGEIVNNTKHKISFDDKGVYISFNELFYTNWNIHKSITQLLKTHRYFCLSEPLESGKGYTATCDLNYVTRSYPNSNILDYVVLNTANSNTVEKYFNYYTPTSASDLKYNSTIKDVIDNWYSSNYEGKKSSKVFDTKVTFANDTSSYAGFGHGENYDINGWEEIYYNSTRRWSSTSYSGEFYNSYDEKDIYGLNGVSGTNQKLTYPIALLTADEAQYMGITTNWQSNNFLNASNNYWLMSERNIYSNVGISSSGAFGGLEPIYTQYVRPVVSILMNDSHVKIQSGDGSADNPIVIDYE